MDLFFYFDPPVVRASSFSVLHLRVRAHGWAELRINLEKPLSIHPQNTQTEGEFKIGMITGEKEYRCRVFASPVAVPGIYKVFLKVFLYDMDGRLKEQQSASLLLKVEK